MRDVAPRNAALMPGRNCPRRQFMPNGGEDFAELNPDKSNTCQVNVLAWALQIATQVI